MPEPIKELTVKEPEMISQASVSSSPKTEQSDLPTVQDKTTYTQNSVLKNFHKYKGERSVKAFIALFDQEPLIGFRQDPPIALSDGKAMVKISFIAMPSGNATPEVKLKGATLISLKKDPDNTNTWIAEVRPDKGTCTATLTVPQGTITMVFPIVVALKAVAEPGKPDMLTKEQFEMFLRDRSMAQKPQYDMNGDGKIDYLDDYIVTANYLVKNPQR